MIQRVIKKTDVKQLVKAALKEKFTVYGPVYENGFVILSELDENSGLVLDYSNVKLPGKRIFFPWSEILCTYKGSDIIEKTIPDSRILVLGLRPCDTLALTYLDKIFAAEDCIDPYYTVRRYNALIISFACKNPAETCFCTEVSGSPMGSEGADVIVYDLDNNLFFEAISEAGDGFLNNYSGIFTEPGSEDVLLKNEFLSAAGNNCANETLSEMSKGIKALSHARDTWEEISEKCLGCGVCTYLCPTCHCFVLRDESKGLRQKIPHHGRRQEIPHHGRRIRVNDSCMFSSFTREASGHNPREEKRTRVRQRFMHKFSYSLQNYNEIFCVGCGRCIVHCPVNLDMREIAGRQV